MIALLWLVTLQIQFWLSIRHDFSQCQELKQFYTHENFPAATLQLVTPNGFVSLKVTGRHTPVF